MKNMENPSLPRLTIVNCLLLMAVAILLFSCVKSLSELRLSFNPEPVLIQVEADTLAPNGVLTFKTFNAGDWNHLYHSFELKLSPGGNFGYQMPVDEGFNYVIVSDSMKIFDTVTNIDVAWSRNKQRVTGLWFDLNGVRIDDRHIQLLPYSK